VRPGASPRLPWRHLPAHTYTRSPQLAGSGVHQALQAGAMKATAGAGWIRLCRGTACPCRRRDQPGPPCAGLAGRAVRLRHGLPGGERLAHPAAGLPVPAAACDSKLGDLASYLTMHSRRLSLAA